MLISTTKRLNHAFLPYLVLSHTSTHIMFYIDAEKCAHTHLQTCTCRKPFFQNSLILHVLMQPLRQSARLHLQTFRVWKFFYSSRVYSFLLHDSFSMRLSWMPLLYDRICLSCLKQRAQENIITQTFHLQPAWTQNILNRTKQCSLRKMKFVDPC